MKKALIIVAVVLLVLVGGFFLAAAYYLYPGPDGIADADLSAQADLSRFAAQIPGVIERHHDPAFPFDPQDLRGHFSIDAGGSEDLYGAADLAYVLWITGELYDRTSAEGRAEWAAVINQYQNPETGLFDQGNDSGESVLHATAFATAALKLLGHKPAHPHRWAEDIFGSPEGIEAWLDSFGWNQIWSGSHDTGAAAAVIDAPEGISLPPDWEEWTLTAFTARLDERTGMWKNGVLDPILRFPTTVDLGGAAHFWWIYDHLAAPIPEAETAIRSTLRLQRDTGIWGARVFNGAFPQGIDFDAINGYRILLPWTSPEFREEMTDEILASVDRYAAALEFHLNRPDSLTELYRDSHKLVGVLNTIAEVDVLYRQLTGRRKITGMPQWRSALTFVAWQ